MKTLDKPFAREIVKRIKNRAKYTNIKIDKQTLNSMENGKINYNKLKKLTCQLHVDPLRLISKDYQKIYTNISNLNEEQLKTLNTIEESIHILYSSNILNAGSTYEIWIKEDLDFPNSLELKLEKLTVIIKKKTIAQSSLLNSPSVLNKYINNLPENTLPQKILEITATQ